MPKSIEILNYKSQDNLDQCGIVFPYTSFMSIGKWVKESRLSAGLTQEQLGEVVGKTKANISSWEAGRHEPSYDQILMIANRSGWKIPLPGANVTSGWPFSSISKTRYDLLSSAQKKAIEEWIDGQITAYTGVDTEYKSTNAA